MTWMLTASGHEVDLTYPRPGQIVFSDIAHSLSLINRFTGHTQRPYSVAEHSLLVLEIVEREFAQVDVAGRLAALMHDAHEAYTNDISSPEKRAIGEGWYHVEHRMERQVRSCFGLHAASFAHATVIRQADLIALATERQQLMHPGGALWECLVHVQPVGWVDLMEPGRVGMGWRDWRDAFSDAYHALDFARQPAPRVVAEGGAA